MTASDREHDSAWLEDELLAALGDLRIRFWICPVDGHSDSRTEDGRPVVTVEWDGDVARCTFPGCGRTSETQPDREGVTMTQTTTTIEKPPVGARVRITETYEDGTRIIAEGLVSHHEPGVDHFVYVGERRYTMLWQSTPPRPRPAQHVDVQVVRLCDICGQDSTVRDGIAGAYLCDANDCLTAAYDRVWPLRDAADTTDPKE